MIVGITPGACVVGAAPGGCLASSCVGQFNCSCGGCPPCCPWLGCCACAERHASPALISYSSLPRHSLLDTSLSTVFYALYTITCGTARGCLPSFPAFFHVPLRKWTPSCKLKI